MDNFLGYELIFWTMFEDFGKRKDSSLMLDVLRRMFWVFGNV